MIIETPQHPPTVLVVSDAAQAVESLTSLLEEDGYRVLAAGDEKQALACARSSDPDAVILAFSAWEARSRRLCRQLRQDAQTALVPILVARPAPMGTARSPVKALAGADDYLTLPLERERALVKVARLTERRLTERRWRTLSGYQQKADTSLLAETRENSPDVRRQWEAIFEALPDGIFVFDADRKLAHVNRAGVALEGAPAAELWGRRCCDVMRASGGECIVERSIAEGRSLTVEYSSVRHKRTFLVKVEPIKDTAGRPAGAVCIVRDLSELRRIEAVARERESLLASILESAREGICALDTAGRLKWCNGALAALGDHRPEALIGQSFLECFHPDDQERISQHFAQTLGGAPQSCEARYVTREGLLRDVLVDSAALVVDGSTTGVICLVRDITEQKQERGRAAQADKLRALGRLASGVAHDFNNALTSILGRVQLMRRLVCDEKLLQHLEVIHTAAADAAATVSRIQTFARQTSSREPELLDAGALVRDAVEITRSHWLGNAGQAKHDVVLDLEDGLYVMGIASELREVLVNLIVNAVDAMPDGGRLTISGARVLDRLRLCFADTGSGMTDAVRERIFEPFYTTKGPGGTGLGLFVSYGIIAQHQGTIYVASEPGRGTTFTIDLPAAGPVAGNRAQPPAGTPGSPLSVLIVDDEPVVRETLADMLEALQHRAVVAESGPKALAALASQRFDLVITDLTMPEMTGQELVQAVRRAHPHVRIIVMTGYGQESATVQTELADGVLDKPFSFAQVEDMIARVTADAATDKALDGTGERLKKSRL